MWIIRIIVYFSLAFIFVAGGIILIIPCFLTWKWSTPFSMLTQFLDAVQDKFVEPETYKTVD